MSLRRWGRAARSAYTSLPLPKNVCRLPGLFCWRSVPNVLFYSAMFLRGLP